jgi:hypothetical protein
MAEKSVRIFEAASGKYVATRDAVETDDSSNARIIERIDLSSGKGLSTLGFPKRGNVRTVSYTSGGTHQVVVGDILTGATSGATARVISLTLTSGTWAGGDAAGVLTLCDQTGTFTAEDLNEGLNANVCSIAGNSAASTLTSADGVDLTALPAEMTQNLITVGDKSAIIVSVEQFTSGGTITITPIIFDEAGTGVVGILQPKVFAQPYAFRRGSASGMYVLPSQMWDCFGAYKVGLHMSAISGASNYPYVYAFAV